MIVPVVDEVEVGDTVLDTLVVVLTEKLGEFVVSVLKVPVRVENGEFVIHELAQPDELYADETLESADCVRVRATLIDTDGHTDEVILVRIVALPEIDTLALPVIFGVAE